MEYSGWKNDFSSDYRLGTWRISGNASLLASADSLNKTQFLRHKLDISKTFGKIIIGAREEGERLGESLERMVHPATLKAIDKAADSRVTSSKFAGTADGTVLGIFGMGMPDIPIFLGLLLKSCYEIAAAYGFDYRDPREKKFTIAVLKTAFSRDEERVIASRECDDLGGIMERSEEFEREITEEDLKDIASVLATDMLVAKFLQGFTFFGVVGGAFNYGMMSKISKAAKLKYKKRFLYKHMLRLQG